MWWPNKGHLVKFIILWSLKLSLFYSFCNSLWFHYFNNGGRKTLNFPRFLATLSLGFLATLRGSLSFSYPLPSFLPFLRDCLTVLTLWLFLLNARQLTKNKGHSFYSFRHFYTVFIIVLYKELRIFRFPWYWPSLWFPQWVRITSLKLNIHGGLADKRRDFFHKIICDLFWYFCHSGLLVGQYINFHGCILNSQWAWLWSIEDHFMTDNLTFIKTLYVVLCKNQFLPSIHVTYLRFFLTFIGLNIWLKKPRNEDWQSDFQYCGLSLP